MLINVMVKLLTASETVETCPLCSGSVASYEDRLMINGELQMRGVWVPPESPREREGPCMSIEDYIAQNPFIDKANNLS